MKKYLIILVAAAAILLNACTPKDKGDSMTLPIEKYTLANGLDVILHQDHSDPIVSVAIYYHVGSSREVPGKTGLGYVF